MQVERREGYELKLVKAIVMGCQWHGATLALKTQQPVMIQCNFDKVFKCFSVSLLTSVFWISYDIE